MIDIKNTFKQLFILFDLCGTTHVITYLQITLIMTFPCVIETERRVFKSITAAIFHVPYFAMFKPIITSVKTWKTVSLLQSLLRIHGCICWKCASYLNTHLSECQKNLLKRILYFSSDCSVTNNCSGDKQVLLLLWSWPKFCLQDEYLNLLLLFYTDFKLVLS